MEAQPDNIMMLMMLVLPVATEVCAPVLTKFGFQADQGGREGFLSFAICTRKVSIIW